MNSNANMIPIASSLPTTDEMPPEVAAPRSPERRALATAITMAWRAKCAVSSAEDALARARAIAEVAESDAAAAAAAIDKGRERDVAALTSGIKIRGELGGASATRKARLRAEVAADEVEIARAAVGKLEFDLIDLEEKSCRAEIRVQACINAVIATAAVPLLERLEQLKAELPQLQAILHFVRRRGCVDRGAHLEEVPEMVAPLATVTPLISSAIEIAPNFHAIAAEQNPAAERWRAVARALATDADAPLPSDLTGADVGALGALGGSVAEQSEDLKES